QMPAELVVGPIQARVQGHFAPDRAAARDASVAALDSRRYFSLLDELDRLVAQPPLTRRGAGPGAAGLPPAGRGAHREGPQAARLPEDRPADAPGAARGGRAAQGRGAA